MPLVPRNILKEYFMRGDQPTEGQFGSLLDSTANLVDDRFLLGLRAYDPSKAYVVGDTMIYNNALYQCIADATGVFDPVKWQVIASLGSVVYSGTWNALTNSPKLADGTGVKGYYYVVNVAGTRNLGSGPIDFQITDWVIYNGATWDKVDNSQAPVAASDVSFVPNGNITSTNVQDAIDEVRDDAAIEFLLKADKVSGATANDIALLDASGNLIDGGKQLSDYLDKTNSVSYTPSGNYNPATKKYVDDEDLLKADKVIAATVNDIAILDVSGNLVDGGKKLTDYLDKTNTTAYTPTLDYHPSTKFYVDTHHDSLKADKVSGATLNDIATLDASGNLLDSGKKTSDFLSSTTVAVNIPFTPNGDITATNVQAAIVEVRDDTDTKLLTKLNLSGGTMTGAIVLPGNPSSALQAAPKQYVDTMVPLAGGTMTGSLILNANPSNVLGAATKQYVDAADALKLNLSGGTMTGAIVLPGNPSSALQAAPKQYVDTMVPLAGGTMTGSLILNANPSNVLGATTKQYVDAADALKLNLSGGTMTGDLVLFSTGTPPTSASAASKNYVDTKFAAVPAQVKVMVIPFTYSGIVSIGSSAGTTWNRIALQVTVPVASDVFPGATTISAKLVVDYLTASASGCRAGLLNYTDYVSGAFTPILNSDFALPTTGVYTTVIGPSPAIAITGGKSYSVVIERASGTLNVEGASLVLTYS